MSQSAMFHTDKRTLDTLISEAARTQVEHEQDVGDTAKLHAAAEADTDCSTYWVQFDASRLPPGYDKDQYVREKDRWRKEFAREQ